jgi:hypothetical protein
MGFTTEMVRNKKQLNEGQRFCKSQRKFVTKL